MEYISFQLRGFTIAKPCTWLDTTCSSHQSPFQVRSKVISGTFSKHQLPPWSIPIRISSISPYIWLPQTAELAGSLHKLVPLP